MIGVNAAPTQRIWSSGTLSFHFSVRTVGMNSVAMKASPNIAGNAMKAAKRTIFRKTRSCR